MNRSLDQAARQIESERAQIAHEIHDSLLPLLFAASSSLSSLTSRSDDSIDAATRERIDQSRRWIDEAMQTGRRLLTEIYPPELKQTAWTTAASDTVERLIGDDASRVQWQIESPLNQVPDSVAFASYRIVVEAVRNAIRHGKATSVVVAGQAEGRNHRLTVRDDGCGFDPSEVREDRFGIRGMKGRADLVGGRLRVESQAGGPTVVTFEYALPE